MTELDYLPSSKTLFTVDHLVRRYFCPLGFFLLLLTGHLFAQGPSALGIGGFDMSSPADQVFAFDYEGIGKLNYLVFYRPGAGLINIVKNNKGTFTSVYSSSNGIGPYDLASSADRAFAFDYEGNGKQNYMVFYRPGSGNVSIVKSNGDSSFTTAYNGLGIGAYDLRSPSDKAFAFDYEGTGKLNYIVLYRPGVGFVYIMKNNGGTFTSVYQGTGIAGYDLASPADLGLAFDYEGSGKQNYLILYRPGAGTIHIIKNYGGGSFGEVYTGGGIAGYDLGSAADQVIALDYESAGKPNYLVAYRPGAGTIYIIKNYGGGSFAAVYTGGGIGAFDLGSPADRVIAFDYNSSGNLDHLLIYRPGTGIVCIEHRTTGTTIALDYWSPADLLYPSYAAQEFIRINGQTIAVENP